MHGIRSESRYFILTDSGWPHIAFPSPLSQIGNCLSHMFTNLTPPFPELIDFKDLEDFIPIMSPARNLILSGPLPKSQTAILQDDSGRLVIQKTVPLPILPPGRILVKVSYVALNPCDYKMPLRFPTSGCLDGHDFSGEVVDLGPPSAGTTRFALGDRVCGAVHACNPIDKTTGAFAEYVSADAEFTLKVPKGMSMEQAAAIGGTGMGTMGLSLKWCLELGGSPDKPVAEGEGKEVLVYAASTSIGTLALQLLSLYDNLFSFNLCLLVLLTILLQINSKNTSNYLGTGQDINPSPFVQPKTFHSSNPMVRPKFLIIIPPPAQLTSVPIPRILSPTLLIPWLKPKRCNYVTILWDV